MYTEKSVVKCESGLHNRQATFFIQKANEFRSSIWIEVDDRKINAKSLLGVLSMAITTGTEVTHDRRRPGRGSGSQDAGADARQRYFLIRST